MARDFGFIVAVTLLLFVSFTLQAQVNYNQLALLRWYAANQTASFSLNSNPEALVFDGSNIWVSMTGNTLVKMRASDGAVLGNFTVGTAGCPRFRELVFAS